MTDRSVGRRLPKNKRANHARSTWIVECCGGKRTLRKLVITLVAPEAGGTRLLESKDMEVVNFIRSDGIVSDSLNGMGQWWRGARAKSRARARRTKGTGSKVARCLSRERWAINFRSIVLKCTD